MDNYHKNNFSFQACTQSDQFSNTTQDQSATVSPPSVSGSGHSEVHPEPVSGSGPDNIIVNTSISSSVTGYGSENTVIAAANVNNENIQVKLP